MSRLRVDGGAIARARRAELARAWRQLRAVGQEPEDRRHWLRPGRARGAEAPADRRAEDIVRAYRYVHDLVLGHPEGEPFVGYLERMALAGVIERAEF